MWYFPLAMMSFLALVFTQHHYNSKAWTWTCPSNAKVPSRDGTYARHRDSLCLLCVFLVALALCLWHGHEWVCPAVPIYVSLSIVQQVVLQVQPVINQQWSELPMYLLLQRREFPLPVPSHEVSHAHDFNVIWGLSINFYLNMCFIHLMNF